MRISVGIITAPRANPSLPDTLCSLREAGFSAYRILGDDSRSGCWQTWLKLLRRMIADYRDRSSPDYFLLCEDDVIFAAGLRLYLDHNPPPAGSIANLFCTSECHRAELMEWHGMPTPHRAQGSLALLIPAGVAKRILAATPFPDRRDGTDHNIGTFCSRSFFDPGGDVPFVTHSPSLVLHSRVDTSLDTARGREELRQAFCFAESINEVPEISFGSNCPPVHWPIDGIGEFADDTYSARRLPDSDDRRRRLPAHPHTLSVYYRKASRKNP